MVYYWGLGTQTMHQQLHIDNYFQAPQSQSESHPESSAYFLNIGVYYHFGGHRVSQISSIGCVKETCGLFQ